MLNFLDICILMLFIMAFIVGFKRGVIKELVQFIGTIIIFILAFSFKGVVGKILCTYLPFIKFKGVIEGISTINILMYQLIAFILVFSILLIIYEILLKVSNLLQKIVNMTIILIIPSKILGGIVSFLKVYLIVFVIVLLLKVPLGNTDIYAESTIIDFMLYNTPILSNTSKDIVTPIDKIYNLGRKVGKNQISKNDANIEALDIMLKYDIVDKDTIETLISMHKLDDIQGTKNLLNKY